MKYEVIGFVAENNEKREVFYGTFDHYPEAYDYKEWLENSDNWKGNEQQPYIVSIREVDDNWTDIDKDIGYNER